LYWPRPALSQVRRSCRTPSTHPAKLFVDIGSVNPPRLAQLDLGGVNPPRVG
jgi:hypothetical protein